MVLPCSLCFWESAWARRRAWASCTGGKAGRSNRRQYSTMNSGLPRALRARVCAWPAGTRLPIAAHLLSLHPAAVCELGVHGHGLAPVANTRRASDHVAAMPTRCVHASGRWRTWRCQSRRGGPVRSTSSERRRISGCTVLSNAGIAKTRKEFAPGRRPQQRPWEQCSHPASRRPCLALSWDSTWLRPRSQVQ